MPTGELRVLQKLDEYEFGVELRVMRDGINRNGWDYRNIESHYTSFVGKPILCAYVRGEVGDGHNMKMVTDRNTGESYYSFMDGTAERIVGMLSEDANDFRIVDEDGHKWLIAKGRLFRFYAPELVDKIVRTGSMEVSAETDVKEQYKDGDTEVFTVWNGMGVTVLGDKVPPAIPGARIAALSAMRDEFENVQHQAAQLKAAALKNPKSNTKGARKMPMNKKTLAKLSEQFEGYKILAASDDGMQVVMIDKNCDAYSYTFNAEDDGEVIQARIVPAAMSATIRIAGNSDDETNAYDVSVDQIVEYVGNAFHDQSETIRNLNEQIASANARIEQMTEMENNRRVMAAEAVARVALDEFNTNRDAKVEEDVLTATIEDVKAGKYTNSVDENGMWTGDKEVRTRVLAACAETVMKLEKSRKPVYSWSNMGNGSMSDSEFANRDAVLDSIIH